MERPWEIVGKRVLTIPDWHQDLAWVKAILDRERGSYDHIVFLGDEFDSHRPDSEIVSVTEAALFVKELIDGKHGPVTLLLGNHTLAYMEAFYKASRHQTPQLRNICSGYSNSAAKKIAKVFMWADWRRFELFKLVNGRLLSHAGFLGDFWDRNESVEDNLHALYRESQEALENVAFKGSRFFRCGLYRGGNAFHGGPCWLDFDAEFVDELPLPQVVGHTNRKEDPVRQRGTSYCIDGGQSTYALIQPDGSIEFKSIVQTPISKTWVEEPVTITQL